MALLLIISLASCGNNVPANSVFSPEDINGKTIAVAKGTASAALALEFTDGTSTVSVYETLADASAALKAGAADCLVTDSSRAKKAATHGLKVLDDYMVSRDFAFMVALENSDLVSDINSALSDITYDGVTDKIISGYTAGETGIYDPKEEEFSAYITLGVRTDFPPYAYIDDEGDIVGIDVELARAVCDYIGIGLNVVELNADELVTAVQTGRVDMAMSGSYSGSGADGKVVFSNSYTTCTQSIIVRKK
jgi:polar amino acid transport system substrate-binding protein